MPTKVSALILIAYTSERDIDFYLPGGITEAVAGIVAFYGVRPGTYEYELRSLSAEFRN